MTRIATYFNINEARRVIEKMVEKHRSIIVISVWDNRFVLNSCCGTMSKNIVKTSNLELLQWF